MASISYPGDVNDGDAITATVFNERFQPLYKTLNASGISGADGITDDEVAVGALSPDRIAGTAVTLDDVQTFTGNKDFTGNVTHSAEVLEPATLVTSPSDGMSVSGERVIHIRNTSGSGVTLNTLTGGTVGQRLTLMIDSIGTTDSVSVPAATGTMGSTADEIWMNGGTGVVNGSGDEKVVFVNLYYTDLNGTLTNAVWLQTEPETEVA